MPRTMKNLIEKAKQYNGCVVLPEGMDPRVMKAASEIVRLGIARVKVLASPAEAQQACAAAGVSPSGFEVIDPATAPFLPDLVAAFHKRREAKGVTAEQAAMIRSGYKSSEI